MDTHVSAPLPRTVSPARVRAIPARWALAGLVAVGASVRWAASAGHHTGTYFTDEYVYSALAHGIATTGRGTVRGVEATFPALLEPLLAAPFWLHGDPALALRLTQGLHAAAISLAAVPAYLLARHLRLGTGLSLAVAAFVLVHPTLAYASHLLAEPVAFPLALAAFYAGVRTLERPTAAAQLAFLGLAGLAAFARVQYAFLPLALLAGALLVERGAVRTVARRLRLTLAALAVPVGGLLLLDPRRVLGAYWHFPDDWYLPAPLLQWTAAELMLLAYSVGWVLVPGALVGLWLALARPRGRRELAFAALLLPTTVALLLEGALIAAIDSGRFHERYLMLLPALGAVAFCLWWRREGPNRLAVAGIALGLLVLSARLPLSTYTAASGGDDSPTLWSLLRLEALLGKAGASLAFAGAAAALSLVAVVAALRPRLGRPAALGAAVLAAGAMSVGAHFQDAANADRTRAALLPGDARWVDHHGLGGVSLLQAQGGAREGALSHLYWNRSLDQVLLLGNAAPIDSFAAYPLRIEADGRLVARGETLSRPLLVSRAGTEVELTGATLRESAAGFDLWVPETTPRVSTIVTGRYPNGWLAREGTVEIWPDGGGRVQGTLRLTLSLPAAAAANEVRLGAPGVARRVGVEPGRTRVVELAVDSEGPWRLRFEAESARLGDRYRQLGVRGTIRFERAGARRSP